MLRRTSSPWLKPPSSQPRIRVHSSSRSPLLSEPAETRSQARFGRLCAMASTRRCTLSGQRMRWSRAMASTYPNRCSSSHWRSFLLLPETSSEPADRPAIRPCARNNSCFQPESGGSVASAGGSYPRATSSYNCLQMWYLAHGVGLPGKSCFVKSQPGTRWAARHATLPRRRHSAPLCPFQNINRRGSSQCLGPVSTTRSRGLLGLRRG